LPLAAELLDSFGALDKLPLFVSIFGRAFYRRPAEPDRTVVLRKVEGGKLIDEKYEQGDNQLVPFWIGRRLNWEIAELL